MESTAVTNWAGATIESGRDVPVDALTEFYHAVYPGRSLPDTWSWLNRAGFSGSRFPLVLMAKNRVIGHGGGIPFLAEVDGRCYRAAWFIDFAVLPAVARRGLGTRLTESWMTLSELNVTFCNDASMHLFRKCGWVECFATSLHRIFLRPFDHPRLAGRIPGALSGAANRLFFRFADAFYRRFGTVDIDLEPLDDALVDALGAGTSAAAELVGSETVDRAKVVPIRDRDYFAWRIGASPDRAAYRVYRRSGVAMLVKLTRLTRLTRPTRLGRITRPTRLGRITAHRSTPASLDVLWISDSSPAAYATIRGMLASLARWAFRNDYTCVRYCPPTNELSDYLASLKPLVSRPTFAYWTVDRVLSDRLRTAAWDWQLIDSDFEWYEAPC